MWTFCIAVGIDVGELVGKAVEIEVGKLVGKAEVGELGREVGIKVDWSCLLVGIEVSEGN